MGDVVKLSVARRARSTTGQPRTPFFVRLGPAKHHFQAVLRKGSRRRTYRVFRIGDLEERYQVWVRVNGRPHRALCTTDVSVIAGLVQEFERDVAALIAEGWTRDEEPS